MHTSRDQVNGRAMPCHNDGSLHIKQVLIHKGRPHQLLVDTGHHSPTVAVQNKSFSRIRISY